MCPLSPNRFRRSVPARPAGLIMRNPAAYFLPALLLSAAVVSLAFSPLTSRASTGSEKSYMGSGEELYRKGKYREAEVQFAKAAGADEKSWEARYWLALSRLKSNRAVGAATAFLSALDLLAGGAPGEVEIDGRAREAFEKGQVLLRSRRDDEAVRQFKKAVSISPEYADAYYALAFAAGSSDDFEGYFSNLVRAVELDPGSANMHRGLAGVYILIGKAGEARRQYERALELDPGSVAVMRLLGPLLMGVGEEDKGLKLLREAAKRSPDDYSVLTSLGLGLAMNGDFEEAEMQLEKAVKINPENPDAVERLGQVYQLQNRFEDSAAKIKEAIALSPRSKKLWMELGKVYELDDSADKAIGAYRKAVSLWPDDFRTLYSLARAYARVEKFDDAIKWYKKAIELMPDQASLHYQLGIIYGLVGRYEEALSQFKSAIGSDPEYVDAYYAIAYLCKEHLKKDGEAAHYYKLYLIFRPDDPQASQIQRWIALVESREVE
ncbi:MAG: tetratricopeptide repeat protein [Candidatus Tritonobacter lacicola]|nr:tetratricopeptide repeat protein [Candidatus Tritonobacter lacicola]